MQTNSGVIEIYRVMGREELCLKNMSSVRGEKKKKNMSSEKTKWPQAESGGKSSLSGPGGEAHEEE